MRYLVPVFIITFLSWSCSKEQDNLRIAAAANLQFAIEEIVQDFRTKTGIECDVIIGSSGKLTAQMMEGAPFDVFLSADLRYPTKLYENGLTNSKPKIYATGNLVLWTSIVGYDSFETVLTSNELAKIAIANPEIAPYGMAAREVLEKMGMYSALESRLVYGESISQVNQFLMTGAVQAVFTSKSVVLSSQNKEGEWFEIDVSYSPINQGAIVLNNRDLKEKESKIFYDYLSSKECKAILTKYGYNVE